MVSTFSALVSMSFISTFSPTLIYQELSALPPGSYCDHGIISDSEMKLLNIHQGLENQIQGANNYHLLEENPQSE